MIKLLQRTEVRKYATRILFQQADIGRTYNYAAAYPHTPAATESCHYCRYAHTFTNLQDFNDCAQKHACEYGVLPFIDMNGEVSVEVDGEWQNPDGTYLTYQKTGIFKQVQFEGQPHHVELYLCNNGQARCNASCWWHAWRLANKRTVTQCGGSHLCQNDGSMWVQKAPTDPTLFNEFIEQL